MRFAIAVIALLACCGCRTFRSGPYTDRDRYAGPPGELVQGMIGVTLLDSPSLEVPATGDLLDDDEFSTFPMAAAFYMLPLRGGEGDQQLGFEFGLSATLRGDADFRSGVGGTTVVENDISLLDASVGLYYNRFLPGGFRFYAGAGPLLQYGEVELELLQGVNTLEFEDEGVGLGYYARTGLEIELSPSLYAGFGVRWLDSYVDLGEGLADFEYEALQIAFSVTSGY